MATRSVIFASPTRTPIGTFGGSLKDLPAPELGALAIRASLQRAGLEHDEIGTVVMGNVVQAGSKMNPGRQAAINAGLPVSVPAMTVNRVCGSGAQAIVSAAQEILLGAVDSAVAGRCVRQPQALGLAADSDRCVELQGPSRLDGEGGYRQEFRQRVVAHQGSAIYFVPYPRSFLADFYDSIGLHEPRLSYQVWNAAPSAGPAMTVGRTPYDSAGMSSGQYGFWFAPNFTAANNHLSSN